MKSSRLILRMGVPAILFLCSLAPLSCESTYEKQLSTLKGIPLVRVRLGNDAPQLTIQVNGPYEIRWSEATGEPSATSEAGGTIVIHSGRQMKPTRIWAADGKLKMGNAPMRANDVGLFATKQGTIGVGRRWYRGWVRLRVIGKDKVRATNYVHAEAYLAGVVGGEMPPRWPLEALKTQAIAARTYALYKISRRGRKDFDLYDDTRSQVYHGVLKETPRVVRAVTETSGVVGTYHPGEGGEARLFSTFYHSTCGGETEDVRYGLGERLIPPLVGGPCRFCKDSPLWRWSGVRISKHDLRTQLAAGSDVLKHLGKIEWVRVENRTPSGRARDLRLRDNRGAEFLISARYFRRTVKGVRITSTGFKIIDRGEEIELSGFGFGHGVGMCQYGARYLADHGKSAVQILRFYYPDIWLVRAY